jgi:Rieske Fe-S protein
MSDDSNRIDVTRRQLLRGAVAAAAATGASSALANCSGGGGGMVDAGAASSYAVGSCQAAMNANVIVCRDAMGIYAYSSTCTHEACVVPPPASLTSFSTCPCHMSSYDANGVVQPGSLATRNLAHFAVTIDSAGNVVVDTTMTVPATTRTPVA